MLENVLKFDEEISKNIFVFIRELASIKGTSLHAQVKEEKHKFTSKTIARVDCVRDSYKTDYDCIEATCKLSDSREIKRF